MLAYNGPNRKLHYFDIFMPFFTLRNPGWNLILRLVFLTLLIWLNIVENNKLLSTRKFRLNLNYCENTIGQLYRCAVIKRITVRSRFKCVVEIKYLLMFVLFIFLPLTFLIYNNIIEIIFPFLNITLSLKDLRHNLTCVDVLVIIQSYYNIETVKSWFIYLLTFVSIFSYFISVKRTFVSYWQALQQIIKRG